MTSLLITAMIPEARAIARAFHLAESPAPVPFWRGPEIALACVGLRARNLAKLTPIASEASPRLVLMVGVAGALAPHLKPGDVVVDVRDSFPPLPPLGAAHLGRLHTSSTLAATPEQKAQLFEQTGCLAVDMETDLVRPFAAPLGAAFAAIRGISDSASEALDSELLTLIDPQGNPRISRAVAALALRPWKLAAMLRLKKSTDHALAAVAQTVELLLASGWPTTAAVRPQKV